MTCYDIQQCVLLRFFNNTSILQTYTFIFISKMPLIFFSVKRNVRKCESIIQYIILAKVSYFKYSRGSNMYLNNVLLSYLSNEKSFELHNNWMRFIPVHYSHMAILCEKFLPYIVCHQGKKCKELYCVYYSI